MDDFDRRILRELQRDAGLPISEVARRVGLSASPCWKRVQRLEREEVIRRRVTLLDPDKVGFGLTVFVSVRAGEHTPEWLERFATAVEAMPEVVELYRMGGDVDYMLRVVAPDTRAYDAFYKRLIEAAPLSEVTSRFAMETMKRTTELPI
jgi:Lrp/AsnC family transcriptional regulator